MGLSQSSSLNTDPSQISKYQVEDFFKFPSSLSINCPITLSSYSPFPESCPARTLLFESFSPSLAPLKPDLDEALLRSMGSFLGMLIGDSFGAPLEFSSLRYNVTELTSFSQTEIWEHSRYNRFRLKPGQWTDDAAMGLCLADSLILNSRYWGEDCRMRYHNWWTYGYNNAFCHDSARGDTSSVGLGGNISESMREFRQLKSGDYTKAGDKFTSGNGSVMRNASVPIYYHRTPALASQTAANQSLSTHQGTEAAECCRLLTHCVLQALNTGSKNFLNNLSKTFESEVYSITCLAASINEVRCESNENMDLADRKWNWKKKSPKHYKYANSRASKQPGYIGSYAMDALAMALHCVYSTESFEEAMIKVVNLRGDADSVGSVVGQIAGAIYGVEAIPEDWRKTVLRWEVRKGDIGLRAWCLYYGQDEEKKEWVSLKDLGPSTTSAEVVEGGGEKKEEGNDDVKEEEGGEERGQENSNKKRKMDEDQGEEQK